MAYDLIDVNAPVHKGGILYDRLHIGEQMYASGQEIQFTNFTSCIGVVARKGSTLTGVHLVMVGNDVFDRQAASDVIKLLPDAPEEVCIVGHIDVWMNPQNGTAHAAFLNLVGRLNHLKRVQAYPKKDGVYGARIEQGHIKITQTWVQHLKHILHLLT